MVFRCSLWRKSRERLARLPSRHRRRRCGAACRRTGGPDRRAEDAAAAVVLRPARQRAVRRDHPAPGVLPHSHGTGDPRRPRTGDRRRHRCRDARRAGQRHVGQDAAAAHRVATGWGAAPVRALRRRPVGAAAGRGRAHRRVPGPDGRGGGRRLHPAPPRAAPRPPAAGRGPRLHPRPHRTRHLGELPHGSRRLVAFLGSTIGNLEPGPRAAFLAELAATLRPGDSFLLGTDLVKDPVRLVRAYDDAAGVTAAFNKNVLTVLDRELEADFDLDAFDHVALWDAEQEWIEMRLRSRLEQVVSIAALDLEVRFATGEELRTEVSAKFRRQGVERELAAAGLTMTHWWTDPGGDFALSLSIPG